MKGGGSPSGASTTDLPLICIYFERLEFYSLVVDFGWETCIAKI